MHLDSYRLWGSFPDISKLEDPWKNFFDDMYLELEAVTLHVHANMSSASRESAAKSSIQTTPSSTRMPHHQTRDRHRAEHVNVPVPTKLEGKRNDYCEIRRGMSSAWSLSQEKGGSGQGTCMHWSRRCSEMTPIVVLLSLMRALMYLIPSVMLRGGVY